MQSKPFSLSPKTKKSHNPQKLRKNNFEKHFEKEMLWKKKILYTTGHLCHLCHAARPAAPRAPPAAAPRGCAAACGAWGNGGTRFVWKRWWERVDENHGKTWKNTKIDHFLNIYSLLASLARKVRCLKRL